MWSRLAPLSKSKVLHVPREAGVYILTRKGVMRYVGRSLDLFTRLMKHVEEDYDCFCFLTTATEHEAYEVECQLWHNWGSYLDHQEHPAKPGIIAASCPMCEAAHLAAASLASTEPSPETNPQGEHHGLDDHA
jgi:hypothetical protein